jgi:hypothetical protein
MLRGVAIRSAFFAGAWSFPLRSLPVRFRLEADRG